MTPIKFTGKELNVILAAITSEYLANAKNEFIVNDTRELLSVGGKVCEALSKEAVPPMPSSAGLDDDNSDPYTEYRTFTVKALFELYASANTYDGNFTREHAIIVKVLNERLARALQCLDESDGSEIEARKIYYDFINPC